MAKPIQICLTHTREACEQDGQHSIGVLLDDGRIFLGLDVGRSWNEISGPWQYEPAAPGGDTDLLDFLESAGRKGLHLKRNPDPTEKPETRWIFVDGIFGAASGATAREAIITAMKTLEAA